MLVVVKGIGWFNALGAEIELRPRKLDSFGMVSQGGLTQGFRVEECS